MELSFKQFVPSEVCLQCNGCCRYKEADSAWRPKVGAGDRAGLADLITAGDVLDVNGYIKTIQSCGEHFCRFLNGSDNTCGIYTKRPLECSLYPFILSKTPDAIKVYVHLSCPFVQDHLPQADYEAYVLYLKDFFGHRDIKEFIRHNNGMFHDYSSYELELLHLFDLTSL